jgi:rhodanese-related sulfurtransferase
MHSRGIVAASEGETMAQRITVPQAREILERDPKAIYLDVRTEEEFADGHPERAINIPIGHSNPATRMLEANPDFARVARAVLPPDTPILVGCRTGPRAEMAAQVLAGEGFSGLSVVHGGYVGMTGPAGNRVAIGWIDSGYPIAHDPSPGASYQDLKKKAGV